MAQALARIPALQPDVAVLDVRLPDGNGIELCRELLSRLPNLRCLMLTSFTSDEAMLDAILAGASGYVVKDIKGMELAQAIKEVGAGRSLLDNRAAAALMAKLRGAAGTLRSVVRTQRPGARAAGPARRGPDQQADRGQDVPRREDGEELRVPVVGQARHGTPHPGGGVRLQAGPIPPPARGVSRSGRTGHDHRHASRLGDRRTDRTEQHSGESATAVAADDGQLRRLRLLEQLTRGPVQDDDASHAHVGIALLPSRQPLGQRPLQLVVCRSDQSIPGNSETA